jgi:hypothetical protein
LHPDAISSIVREKISTFSCVFLTEKQDIFARIIQLNCHIGWIGVGSHIYPYINRWKGSLTGSIMPTPGTQYWFTLL